MATSLLEQFKRTTRLPSPPGTAMEVLRLSRKPDVSISELADTVAADRELYQSKDKGRNTCSMKQLQPERKPAAVHG